MREPPHPLYNMRRADGVPPRWVATVYYRTDAGLIDVEHQFEELDMLHMLIERGPSFYAIDRIEIRLSTPNERTTIESALAE